MNTSTSTQTSDTLEERLAPYSGAHVHPKHDTALSYRIAAARESAAADAPEIPAQRDPAA